MSSFLYCLSKALATPRKKSNKRHGERDTQVENLWPSRSKLSLFDTEEQS